jgi:DNA-binding GntR family transcriptional regulator
MDLVYETILQAIKTKTLTPGSRVTEAGLAAQLRVSKTPVREALLRLKEIGLIEDAGRRGGRITVASVDSIRATFGAREALEVYLAAEAASVASAEQIEEIQAAALGSSQAAREDMIERYSSLDATFHRAITDAVGNPLVSPMLENVLTRVSVFRERELPAGSSFSLTCGEEHIGIAEAIAKRDSELAGRRMGEHVRHVRDYVIERFVASQPTTTP